MIENNVILNKYWQGFADGQPSESIQKHLLSSIAVSVIFPYTQNSQLLKLPVKQFKDYKPKNKAKRANDLSEWLKVNRETGLKLIGFSHAHKQEDAAKFGLKFLEELPNTKVEKHYSTYRLYFENHSIDFAQAVALIYYFFTINFGALRAGLIIKESDRQLVILMDRFTGKSIGAVEPGNSFPITDGMRFINFLATKSPFGKALAEENKKINLDLSFGTLDWWRNNQDEDWKRGKTHPYFIFPDWMSAASAAIKFPVNYAKYFGNIKYGNEILKSLTKLHNEFKNFNIWSMGDNVLEYIVPEKKSWIIPDDAREFIMKRANRD